MKLKELRFETGQIYEVEYYDHFSLDDASIEIALRKNDTVFKTYGMCLGENQRYVVLCWNFEGKNAEDTNNDTMHIFKKAIVKARKLN
jgi:hypothetical protein